MHYIKIANSTKKTLISASCIVCKGSFSKAIGLMFSPRPKALLFLFKKESYVPLHMNFVFFPIDVLFLDKAKRVIEIKENFMPWSYYAPKKKAMYVIELPCAIIKKSKTKLGDIISINAYV